MTTAVGIGSGSEFWLDNSGGSLTQLAEILAVPAPNIQTEEVEATHMASGAYREFIAGLKDAGEGTLEINWIPDDGAGSTDAILREAHSSGTTRSYKCVFPVADGSSWEITGDCFVKGYERQAPIGDRMTATVTLRFSGAPVEVAGA